MVITEIELREMWRAGRRALPAFPPGTRFSPAAQDFLKDHGLTVRFETSPATAPPAAPPLARGPTLPPGYLAARLDSLHALALLAAAEARQHRLPALAARLDALAAELLALSGPRAAWPPLPPDPADAPTFERPGPHEHVILHWLNLLRATAREAEVLAADQIPPLAPHLHRLGHTLAALAAGFRAGALAWPPA